MLRTGVFAVALFLAGTLLVLPSAAEWGTYGEDGWPINVDGESTNPFPGLADPRSAPRAPLPVPPVNEVGGTTIYPYWPILTAEVLDLAREHPDLVKLRSIGKSTLGLDLWMLEIADFDRIEAGQGIPLERREVVWVDGGTHSNEYSGVYFVVHLARFLTDEYETNETAKWIVENRHSWLMPMINPDGSNAFGRLNAHLVNINRNYPVVWDGQGHDALMNNRGPHPASEVETQLNIEWFNKTQPDYYASVHCCGNLWLYPYGEEGVDPVDEDLLSRVCDQAFPTVRDDCGPIWSTIYPASGSSVDTAYEHTGAVAFGYEMSGRGAVALWGQPFTVESVRTQEFESWNGVLHAFLNVHRYGAHPEVTGVETSAQGLVIHLENAGLGNLTGDSYAMRLLGPGGPVERTYPLDGNLTPGAAWTVRLEAPIEQGSYRIEVDYAKRVEAAPTGTSTADLVLTRNEAGLLESDLAPGTFVAPLEPSRQESAPVPPLAPLLGVLLLAVAVRRAARR